MESHPSHHSAAVVVSSPSTSPKQIVEVHSPQTSRALIKKSGQDLNQQRPVLHKYSAEQVEVVYHRRSGAKEVVGTNKRKKRLSIESDKTPSSQSFSNKHSQSPSTASLSLASDDCRSSIGSVDTDSNSSKFPQNQNQNLNTLEDIGKEVKFQSSNAKGVLEMNRLGLSFESLAVNISDGEDESQSAGGFSVDETVDESGATESELVSKISDLTTLVKKLSEDVVCMDSRIKKLESDTRAIEVDNSFLHERYIKHLQANSHVASDMKKIQSLLNSTSGISIMENEIENLVKRVKRSNDGVEKVMYTNGNGNGNGARNNRNVQVVVDQMELNENSGETHAAGQTAHPGPTNQ